MFSFIHYFKAKERLLEANKTVLMMGGESECQEMILAQRDMIELEMKYYYDEMLSFCLNATATVLFLIAVF